MWDILSNILNIGLGLWVFYLYLENRKLKRFAIDKEIELKEQQIEECETDRWNKINSFPTTTTLMTDNFKFAEYEIERRNKINKIEIELKHLKRIKE